MESRIRLAIDRYGLPAPELQFPVGRYRLDLAYPRCRLGIEYDGREHLTPERARRDLRREAELAAAGWTVLRLTARTVHHPHEVAILIRRALHVRGIDTASVSPAW